MSRPSDEPGQPRSAIDLDAWNRIAAAYADATGGDRDRILSMLAPALWSALGPDLRDTDVLDLGCGDGWLSAHLAKTGARVRGIDGSTALLERARRAAPGVEFLEFDLVRDALPLDRRYARIVAHMVLMDLPDLRGVFDFVRRTLAANGRFVFTLTHPCFFNYGTRRDPETGRLVCAVHDYLEPAEWWIESYGGHRHYHRSLSFYVNALFDAGLTVTHMYEAPHVGRDADDERAAFFRGISKFMLVEAEARTIAS